MGARSVPRATVIPQDRINPIARKLLLSTFRVPTRRRPPAPIPWRNNFVFAPNLAYDTFYNIATKVDQNISDKTQMFFRYAQNKRTEKRYTNGITSGPAQDGQLPLERINYTGVADWVRTVGNSLVLNIRGSVNQYIELARSDPGLALQPDRARLPVGAGRPAAEPGVPAHQPDHDYQPLGRQGFNRETTTVLQPAAELLVDRRASTTSAAASTCA